MKPPHVSELTPNPNLSCLDERHAQLLKQAVEKLVRFGQEVGVTPDEMISLLDSGISVQDLLAFLAAKNSGAA